LNLDITIHHTYQEVAHFWNNSLPLEHQLLLPEIGIVQDANIHDITPCYIVVKNNNEIEALLYAQILRVKPQYIIGNNLSRSMQWLSKNTLTCFNVKLLVLGNLFRHDGSFIYIKNKSKELETLKYIVDYLQAHIKHTAFFVKDIQQQYAAVFCNDATYNTFPNDFSMQLQVRNTWHSLLDYSNDLTKKYRQRVGKTQDLFKDVIVKELNLQDIEQEKEAMYDLYRQVTLKQSITLGLLNAAYFVFIKKILATQLHAYGFYYNNKLIGFSTAIVKDGVYDMNYIGFDYELNGPLNLYFNMLFSFLQHAIEKKCHTLVMGRTALEAKAIMGCKAVPVFGFYKIKNRLLNNVAIRFAKNTTTVQGEAWRDRHPFKN
jgi:hypothetical protein